MTRRGGTGGVLKCNNVWVFNEMCNKRPSNTEWMFNEMCNNRPSEIGDP